MGDQFGLSLYNNGSLAPVVNRSLAYMKPQEAQKPAPEDPPVQPEPQAAAEPEQAHQPAQPSPTAVPAQAVTAAPTGQPAQQGEPVAALKAKVNNGWNNADSMRQNLEEARRNGLLEHVVQYRGGPMRMGDMIQHRIDELDGAGQRAA